MAYTAHDTPDVVRRVGNDLATAASAVRDADPRLRSLVLTGAFARGEGAFRGGRPQNDYDLVALRGMGRPRVPYARLRESLGRRLGLHVDLAPVASWRLRHVARTIFWYETALRGRVLWGRDLLDRIPVRSLRDLDPAEGLRLLSNRAAGLLLAAGGHPDDLRLQAAKALLASCDAHLLAAGEFPPSQTERWARAQALRARGSLQGIGEAGLPWTAWAYRHKVDPDRAAAVDAGEAWGAARRAVLGAVPVALRHARLDSLEAYARRDGVLDHLAYLRRSSRIPAARHMAWHPTGRVRVAALRLLEASPDGEVRDEEARRCLGPIARRHPDPLRLLEDLRRATLP